MLQLICPVATWIPRPLQLHHPHCCSTNPFSPLCLNNPVAARNDHHCSISLWRHHLHCHSSKTSRCNHCTRIVALASCSVAANASTSLGVSASAIASYAAASASSGAFSQLPIVPILPDWHRLLSNHLRLPSPLPQNVPRPAVLLPLQQCCCDCSPYFGLNCQAC